MRKTNQIPFWAPLLLLVACGGGGGGGGASGGDGAAVGVTSSGLSGGGGTPAAPSPTTTAAAVPVQGCAVGDLSSTVIPAVNRLRAAAQVCGTTAMPAAGALTWDARLAEAARRHSTDMAAHNFFDHTGSDGSDAGTRVKATGYDWTFVGENLAARQADLATALSGWMRSPGHCLNLMNDKALQIGLACVQRSSGRATPYWTMVLARPRP